MLQSFFSKMITYFINIKQLNLINSLLKYKKLTSFFPNSWNWNYNITKSIDFFQISTKPNFIPLLYLLINVQFEFLIQINGLYNINMIMNIYSLINEFNTTIFIIFINEYVKNGFIYLQCYIHKWLYYNWIYIFIHLYW